MSNAPGRPGNRACKRHDFSERTLCRRGDRLKVVCRACRREATQRWRKKNAERAKATAARWRAENRQRVRELQMAWIEGHREKKRKSARETARRIRARRALGEVG